MGKTKQNNAVTHRKTKRTNVTEGNIEEKNTQTNTLPIKHAVINRTRQDIKCRDEIRQQGLQHPVLRKVMKPCAD